MNQTFWLTNSLSGKKEKLETIEPGKLTMYSCGPTVYGLIHIGNLRSGVVSDLFYRAFQKAGYEVTYVRNYTDVDDKIINKANEEGRSSEEVAAEFVIEVEKDYQSAHMLEPTLKTKATEYIQPMIRMIESIIKEGKAYVTETGEVLFSVEDFQGYGKLSGKNLEELEAGARVEVSDQKRSPFDFTLWKPAKPGEPSWDSPWGKGRPGWHIECSAMIHEAMGPQIDIHHGGEDLVFPHHENEIAQSEAACGKSPFVKVWLHHAFLTFNQTKMSKSLGNVFNARTFIEQYGGELARWMLLSVHYRKILDFSEETIDHSLSALERLYEAKLRATQLKERRTLRPDPVKESVWGEFVSQIENYKKELNEAISQDFNTPEVFSVLFRLVREFNRIQSTEGMIDTPSVSLAAECFLNFIEKDFGEIMGLGGEEPRAYLKFLGEIRSKRMSTSGAESLSSDEIEVLIQERKDARASKDYAKADEIRNHLLERGVEIKDGPQGTTWKYV